MRSSAEDALNLLGKWENEEASLLVNWREENGIESHRFWARRIEVSEVRLVLSSEFVVMQIPLDFAEFEFKDLREAPEPTKSAYRNFESSLWVRSGRFLVLLMSSISGSPVPIVPPDVV